MEKEWAKVNGNDIISPNEVFDALTEAKHIVKKLQ